MIDSRKIIILLLVFIAVLVGVGIRQYLVIQDLKENIPFLRPGEVPGKCRFINLRENQIRDSIYDSDLPVVVCLLSRPCLMCNGNLKLWNQMARILKGDAEVVGIILPRDPKELTPFQDNRILTDMGVYTPVDRQRFIDEGRAGYHFAQTMVFIGGRIKYLAVGPITGRDAEGIIQLIQSR